MDIFDNPFAGLFPSLFASKHFIQECEFMSNHVLSNQIEWKQNVNDLLERNFFLTVNSDVVLPWKILTSPCYVYMSEFEENMLLEIEHFDQVLFERLLLSKEDLEKRLVYKHNHNLTKWKFSQYHPITYLLHCYQQLQAELQAVSFNLQPIVHHCLKLVVRNLSTSLLNPEMYAEILKDFGGSSSIHQKLLHQLQDASHTDRDALQACVRDVATYIHKNTTNSSHDLSTAFSPILEKLLDSIFSAKVSIADPILLTGLDIVSLLSSVKELASLLVEYRSFSAANPSSTVFESILAKSGLVTNPQWLQHDFFDDLKSQKVDEEESRFHNCLDIFHSKLYAIFHNILHHQDSKFKLLSWIGKFLKRYESAAKMWMHEHSDPQRSVFPSDAVFLNLASVLIRLSLPFCVNLKGNKDQDWKFLKINPSYCKATGMKERDSLNIHAIDLHKETCLLSHPEESAVALPQTSYNFVTECFFLTHRALQIGMHGLLTKFYRLNRELGRMRASNQDPALFEKAMTVYLSIKATLSEQSFIENLGKFHVTTACFLNQIAFTDDRSKLNDYRLPFTSPLPASLSYVPEFVMENLTDYIVFLKRFIPTALEEFGDSICHFLLLVTIYMGHKSRLSNPHLRASLAEVMEAILPLEDENATVDGPTSCRKENFDNFKYADYIPMSVIQLFVDIEFTGDPHQFEQKFNYRRSLYPILKFLWRHPRGKTAIEMLSVAAVENIENASPPILLSFFNLFLNDSIHLLDEAIDLLKQIKTNEEDRNSGKWEELTRREREEKELNLNQLVMIARFHNIMSNETMHALSYLTNSEKVNDLLCLPILVDRVASMLSYFLKQLVGPKMGTLKIRDFTHCEFKPKELLYSICKTIANFRGRGKFCVAMSQDERSYDCFLFPRALHVLNKIGHRELCDDVKAISQSVKACRDEQNDLDQIYQTAPEEFFDPIMGSLMQDPVVLPTSNVTVDRATIARHLLSDHTDPFNRTPLTMEDIEENADLLQRIKTWMNARTST